MGRRSECARVSNGSPVGGHRLLDADEQLRRTTPLVNPMKSIVCCDYVAVAKPVPNDDQVLIKVRAASQLGKQTRLAACPVAIPRRIKACPLQNVAIILRTPVRGNIVP